MLVSAEYGLSQTFRVGSIVLTWSQGHSCYGRCHSVGSASGEADVPPVAVGGPAVQCLDLPLRYACGSGS